MLAIAGFPTELRLSDPAHGPANGLSSKGPDNEAVPLCRFHHDQVDGHVRITSTLVGRKAFERFYDVDLKDIAARCWEIYPARYGEYAATGKASGAVT